MTPFLRKLLGMNWLLFASVVVISLAGILFVNGAGYFNAKTKNLWQGQVQWVGIGIVVFLIMTMIDFRWAKWLAIPLYLAGTAFTALTYTGLGKAHGSSDAKCWLKLPGFIEFQPAQLAVTAGVLTIALFLSVCRRWHAFFKLAGVAIIAAPPMLLILKQPDFGMTMVWVPVIMSMLWVGGLPKRWVALVLLVGLTLLPLVINFGLKQYQRDRIVTFMNPDYDPSDKGFAINQSLIGIGSAGMMGKGYKASGTQLEMGLIPAPVAPTDYIFATIAEQWGFVGGVAVVSAFGVLLTACLLTALRTTDPFGILLVGGFVAQVFFHVFQNIGMTIALMPITGLPLPLVSYGGTFVLLIMFSLGLVNSVWVHRDKPEEKKPPEKWADSW